MRQDWPVYVWGWRIGLLYCLFIFIYLRIKKVNIFWFGGKRKKLIFCSFTLCADPDLFINSLPLAEATLKFGGGTSLCPFSLFYRFHAQKLMGCKESNKDEQQNK